MAAASLERPRVEREENLAVRPNRLGTERARPAKRRRVDAIEECESVAKEDNQAGTHGFFRSRTVFLNCTEPACSATVVTLYQLHRHLKNVHHLLPYLCKAVGCDMRFKKFCQLGRHIQQHHQDISNWPCPEADCTSSFASQNRLYKHTRRYHQRGLYACATTSKCPFQANRLIEVKQHQEQVHAAHCCPYPACGLKFNRAFNLKKHQRIHSDEKPYICAVRGCGGYASQELSNVYRHIRTVHMTEPQGYVEEALLQQS